MRYVWVSGRGFQSKCLLIFFSYLFSAWFSVPVPHFLVSLMHVVVLRWLTYSYCLVAKKRFQLPFWVASQIIQRINKGKVAHAALRGSAGWPQIFPFEGEECDDVRE